jgi:hypothetical protein
MTKSQRIGGRREVLARAALSGKIEIQPNGWGLSHQPMYKQGEWISSTLIREWETLGLITITNSTGTITEKGLKGDYKNHRDENMEEK